MNAVCSALVVACLFVVIALETKSKPFNNDGICETIVVENGKVISLKEYLCE
jgi:hypothetical protein